MALDATEHPLQKGGLVRASTKDAPPKAPLLQAASLPKHFAKVAEGQIEPLLQKLGLAPRILPKDIHALFRAYPGVRLEQTPKNAPEALLVFTNLSCPSCAEVESIFKSQTKESLLFPVYFFPAGSKAHARSFSAVSELSEQASLELESGAKAINAFLEKHFKGKVPTPCFCWTSGGDWRISALSGAELTVLVASLNASTISRKTR